VADRQGHRHRLANEDTAIGKVQFAGRVKGHSGNTRKRSLRNVAAIAARDHCGRSDSGKRLERTRNIDLRHLPKRIEEQLPVLSTAMAVGAPIADLVVDRPE